jgi:hypothetical protein
MTEFHDWDDIRAELDDGDRDALAAERARTEAWASGARLRNTTIWTGSPAGLTAPSRCPGRRRLSSRRNVNGVDRATWRDRRRRDRPGGCPG